jgi:hypothetical protein
MNRRKLLTSLAISLLAGQRIVHAEEPATWVLLAREAIAPGHSQIETAISHGSSRISGIRVFAADIHIKVGWLETITTRGQTTRHEINQRIVPGSVSSVIMIPSGSRKIRLSVSRLPKIISKARVEVWGLATA